MASFPSSVVSGACRIQTFSVLRTHALRSCEGANEPVARRTRAYVVALAAFEVVAPPLLRSAFAVVEAPTETAVLRPRQQQRQPHPPQHSLCCQPSPRSQPSPWLGRRWSSRHSPRRRSLTTSQRRAWPVPEATPLRSVTLSTSTTFPGRCRQINTAGVAAAALAASASKCRPFSPARLVRR